MQNTLKNAINYLEVDIERRDIENKLNWIPSCFLYKKLLTSQPIAVLSTSI